MIAAGVGRRRRRTAIAVVAAAALLAGCRSVDGTASAGEPDAAAFEGKTGEYSPTPPKVADPRTESQGIVMESMRLGDVVAAPAQIDATLDDNWTDKIGPVLTPDEATGTYYNHLFAGVARPVIEKYKMLGGFVVAGADLPVASDGQRPNNATSITMTILRFPDDESAKKAADEIDAADFAQSGENQAVDIPGYPEANSHWRPNFPSLAATTAHGPFVVDVFVFRPAPDKGSLTSLVAKAYDTQFPKLDEYKATPPDEIADLPADPDGLFARSLSTTGDITVDGHQNWMYDVHGFSLFLDRDDHERLTTLFTDAGVEQIAVTSDTSVLRARDEESAKTLTAELAKSDDRKTTDGPQQIAEYTACFERTSPAETEYRFGCYIRYREYVASIQSDDKTDLTEKSLAQFGVFANAELN